jgi:meiotically up-regulated gene 157 (Mug157) protein
MSYFTKRNIYHELARFALRARLVRACTDTLSTMFRARAFGLFIALVFFGWASAGAGVRESSDVAATLERIYLTAYDEAINRHAIVQRDGTTYVSTGDISAEWLRDASVVAEPYIPLAVGDPDMAATLRGVIAREARYILLDPYANAFSADYHVVEEKFEIDSLLYPIDLACLYWQMTGDRSIFTPTLRRTFDRVLEVLRDEQHHASRSRYRNPQLANHGAGTPVRETGMIWTGFRPSDDPVRYHYNIPANMFAVVTLRRLSQVEGDVLHNRRQAANAWGLALQVQRGIEHNAVVNLPGFGRIYAYEADGFGHMNLMDDANIPSLLSIPYFGYLPQNDPVYRATRSFVLSSRNPYFYQGHLASGIGSPHTPKGYVWPLALVMQAYTSSNAKEQDRALAYLASSDTGDHRLHESFDVNYAKNYTRADFAWPNALYAQYMIEHRSRDAATLRYASRAP